MTDQNDFPMPMIKTPEYAANQIYLGLIKKKVFEIHFPKTFTFLMKIIRIMPNSFFFKIMEKGIKKIKH